MGKWDTSEILRKGKGRKGNWKLTGDKNIAGCCSTEERASQMTMANEIPHRCLGSASFSPLSICFWSSVRGCIMYKAKSVTELGDFGRFWPTRLCDGPGR